MKLTYYVAASLDGYIAEKNGSVAWLDAFTTDGLDYGYFDFYNPVDALIMGRRTFDQILTFGKWPYPGKPCYVVTSKEIANELPEIISTNMAPLDLVNNLKSSGFKNAWLVGGAKLAGSFRSQGLIDEYIVTIMPVILGSGSVQLFDGDTGKHEAIQLVKEKSYANGVVQLCYKSEAIN